MMHGSNHNSAIYREFGQFTNFDYTECWRKKFTFWNL